MRKIKTCAVVFTVYAVSALAQVTINPEETVDRATGQMGFSLPLATVKSVNDRSFPVKLNYKVGVRLHDDGTAAGLGFSYSPGIIVRKEVHINDDNEGGTEEPDPKYSDLQGADATEPEWLYIINKVFAVNDAIGSVVLNIVSPGVGTIVSMFANLQMMALNKVVMSGVDFRAGGTHIEPYDECDGKGFFHGGTGDAPDIYFIYTPFVSGQFVWVGDYSGGHFALKKTPGSIAAGKQTTKIERRVDAHGKTLFTVTLPDGTRLIFDKYDDHTRDEILWTTDEDGDAHSCTGSKRTYYENMRTVWHLTAILYPDYVDGPGGNDLDPLDSEGQNKGAWVAFEYLNPIAGRNLCTPWALQQRGPRATSYTRASFNQAHMHTVEYIRTPNEYVKYDYDLNRKDLTLYDKGASYAPFRELPVIKSISVYTKRDILRKRIDFATAYHVRPNTYKAFIFSPYFVDDHIFCSGELNLDYPADNPHAKSLTLESVQIVGEDGKRMPPVQFEYYHPEWHAYGKETAAPDALVRSWTTFDYRCECNSSWLTARKNKCGYYCQDNLVSWDDECIRKKYWHIEQMDLWGYFRSNLSSANDFNETGAKENMYFGNPNVPYAAAWSVNRVNLPSGLRIEWEYECNRYDRTNGVAVEGNPGEPRYGGGVRVKRLLAYSGINNSPDLDISYFYTATDGDFDEATGGCSGYATIEPYNYIDEADYRTSFRTRGGLYTPTAVLYEKVQVVRNHDANTVPHAPDGYVVYDYSHAGDPALDDYYPNLGQYGEYDMGWKRGNLLSTAVYNSGKDLISLKKMDYRFEPALDMSDAYVRNGMPCLGTTELVNVTEKLDGVEKKKALKYAQDFTPAADGSVSEADKVTKALIQSHNFPKNVSELDESFGWTFGIFETNLFGSASIADYVVAAFNNCYVIGYGGDPEYTRYYLYFKVLIDLVNNNGYVEYSSESDAFFIDDWITSEPTSTMLSVQSGVVGNYVLTAKPDFSVDIGGGTIETVKDITVNPDGSITVAGQDENSIGTYVAPLGVNSYSNNSIFTVFQTGTRTYDLDGQANQMIEYAADGSVYRVTRPLKGYWKYAGMESKHMLTQKCGSETFSSTSMADNDIVSAKVMTWDDDADGVWRPESTCVWRGAMDGDGKLSVGQDYDGFNFADLTANDYSHWLCQSIVHNYDRFGQPIDALTRTGVDYRRNSTVYGHNGLVPIAKIQNANYKNSSAFTCDYSYDELHGTTLYFDYETGWEKGGSSVTTGWNAHFGEECVRVLDDYGPTHNFKIDDKNDYIFSAWVRVNSGAIKLNVDFHKEAEVEIMSWPISPLELGSVYDAVHDSWSAGDASDWKYVELKVPAQKILQDNDRDIGYLRCWIGNPAGVDAYIDDVRFHPDDALVTTTYYSLDYLRPICTVDPNGQPSHRIGYDGLGRPTTWEKVKRKEFRGANSGDLLVQRKEYHLMRELVDGEHIRLEYPNGGEEIKLGDRIIFRWINDSTRDIDFYISIDGGDWQKLSTSEADHSGWGVVYGAEWGVTGNENLIKVVDANDGTTYDVSDAPFKIVSP